LSRKQHEPLGMGNKPNAADPLTDIEINKFYDDNLLIYVCKICEFVCIWYK
jgi:hypothetical protein